MNDDRFPSLVKRNYTNFGYNFALIDQKDKFPGSFRQGDTNSITRSYPEFFYYMFTVHTAEENGEHEKFDLCQNYPNPFNVSTHIEYYLPKPSFVKIDIIDELGREVETLVNNESSAGSSYTIFNGENFSSGVYFYRMFVNGSFFESQKMVLLR